MKQTSKRGGVHAGRGHWSRLGVAALALTVGACNTDKLVHIDNPDVIPQPVAADPANIESFRNGVFYEFARALSGPASNNGTPGIVGLTAVFTDEMWYASTFVTMRDIDRRVIDVANSDLLRAYQYLHRARNLSEQAILQYAASTQANSADHALMANFAGLTYVYFAENFCSGVPFSVTNVLNETTYGPALTTAQTLDSAAKRFDAALALAPANAAGTTQKNLAHLGKARVLLAKGDYTGAAAEAALVGDGFQYAVEYSDNSAGQQNGVWWNNDAEGRSSAASGEGTNGLVFFRRGPKATGTPPTTTNTIDPRTPADSAGFGLGFTVPRYVQLKYPEGGAGIPVGSTTEARLIQAEAALNKGQSGSYLNTLNALRLAAGMAPNLVDPVTVDGRVRQFFSERAFWLWMTGHRLGDLRRMMRDYGYTQDQVFPTGVTIRPTVTYGTNINFPIPFQEQNNPQFANGSCINRLP